MWWARIQQCLLNPLPNGLPPGWRMLLDGLGYTLMITVLAVCLGVAALVNVVPAWLGTLHQAMAVGVLTAALGTLHALRRPRGGAAEGGPTPTRQAM